MVDALPRPSRTDVETSPEPADPAVAGSAVLTTLLTDESFRTVRELLLVANWLTERSKLIDE